MSDQPVPVLQHDLVDLVNDLLLLGRHLVARRERPLAVRSFDWLDLDRETLLRQIPHVPDRRHHREVAAQVLADCLRLRRRFDDHKLLAHFIYAFLLPSKM